MAGYMTVILLFFGFSLSACSQFPLRQYYYVGQPMSWFDAQQYCRATHTDLATFESMDDIHRLQPPTFSYDWAWIGLKDDPNAWKNIGGNDSNSWRWSATGETSKTSYQNWEYNDPNNRWGNQVCVQMNGNGQWNDYTCITLLPFVCYTVTDQNEKTYVFISATKTWSSAQAYCREHYTDLAMIESSADNNKVKVAANKNIIWIGLYREPWTWSDNSKSSFRNWISGEPNNYGSSAFCTVESNTHEWDDQNCNNLYPFICQVSTLKTTVRMKIQTDVDITDEAAKAQILQQLGAAFSSQGWTDIKLQLKIQPRKKEKEKPTEPQCIPPF